MTSGTYRAGLPLHWGELIRTSQSRMPRPMARVDGIRKTTNQSSIAAIFQFAMVMCEGCHLVYWYIPDGATRR